MSRVLPLQVDLVGCGKKVSGEMWNGRTAALASPRGCSEHPVTTLVIARVHGIALHVPPGARALAHSNAHTVNLKPPPFGLQNPTHLERTTWFFPLALWHAAAAVVAAELRDFRDFGHAHLPLALPACLLRCFELRCRSELLASSSSSPSPSRRAFPWSLLIANNSGSGERWRALM